VKVCVAFQPQLILPPLPAHPHRLLSSKLINLKELRQIPPNRRAVDASPGHQATCFWLGKQLPHLEHRADGAHGHLADRAPPHDAQAPDKTS